MFEATAQALLHAPARWLPAAVAADVTPLTSAHDVGCAQWPQQAANEYSCGAHSQQAFSSAQPPPPGFPVDAGSVPDEVPPPPPDAPPQPPDAAPVAAVRSLSLSPRLA